MKKSCLFVASALVGMALTAGAAPPAGLIEATLKDEAGTLVDDAVVYLVAAGASGRPQASITMDQIDKPGAVLRDVPRIQRYENNPGG